MNDFIEDLTDHEKYRGGGKHVVEDELQTLKKEQPKRIPYVLMADAKHPGYFSVAWLPRQVINQLNCNLSIVA